MIDESPLTVEEINEMPIEALTSEDFDGIDCSQIFNLKTKQLTNGIPEDLVERIREVLPNGTAFHWYWVWIRAGLHPDKAMFKVKAERIRTRRRHLEKKLASVEIIQARRAA